MVATLTPPTISESYAGEKNLLLGCRNRLWEVAGYRQEQCDVEYDEHVPSIVPDTYIAICPAGWMRGPVHSGGGVFDFLYSVDVHCLRKIGNEARDRLRNTFALRLESINAEVEKVIMFLDFSYDLMQAVNELIETETGSTEGFVEPLRFSSVDSRPRVVSGDQAALSGNDAFMVRTVRFDGASRITHRGQEWEGLH